ncbi:uncharacterized protein C9orf85 homolog [Ochotona curzoniae]|uniref:uncharacterized protein C9orf85 homolog n=1 Tax=Ochotona curzoniae TaxID=130825 RepID=UPI001B350444|nr:uncharacterized protein C9orf85 homolog [Ochotona curzoniae]XP_040836873.1 uncharacterized protein C9orf85 homolog [Ochotona curzoniae]
MSSQKGNVARSRSQKYQNVFAFKNDRHDKSVQTKKINAKLHAGVCQRCKEVLEWRVKYSKYKPLSKPRKCVKCLQKTVKDSYHMICRQCACELQVCAKCGKKEDIIIPFNKELEKSENIDGSDYRGACRPEERDGDSEFDLDLDDTEDEPRSG